MRIAHCLLLFLLPVACRPAQTSPGRSAACPIAAVVAGPAVGRQRSARSAHPAHRLVSGRVRDLAYFRGDLSFLLRFLERSPLPVPPCVAELRPRIDAQYMVTLPAAGPSINVFHGRLNRDAFEACAVAFFAALGREVMVGRQGALSQMTGPSGRDMFVGWVGEEWVLFRRTSAGGNLPAALGRTGAAVRAFGAAVAGRAGAGIWMISTADMTESSLGRGVERLYRNAGRGPGSTADPAAALVFPARRGPKEPRPASGDPRRSAGDAAKLAIASLGPQVVGTQVRVRILPAAFDTAVLRELQQVLEQIQREAKSPGGSPGRLALNDSVDDSADDSADDSGLGYFDFAGARRSARRRRPSALHRCQSARRRPGRCDTGHRRPAGHPANSCR